jgi:hypothetical protein
MKIGNRTRFAAGSSLLLTAVVLGGCGSLRDAVGANKQAPDEFAVVTKAPLVIPPDFNLRPPSPGAPPTNQLSPTNSAQAALYATDPVSTAAAIPGNMSQGEKLLLAYANAATADSSIRQLIAADNRNLQPADEGFTDSLMFWQKSGTASGDQGVDADAEAKHLSQSGATPAAPPPASADQSIQKDDGTNNAH